MKSIVIAGEIFKTQISLITEVRLQLSNIGVCDSIKSIGTKPFIFFTDLCLRHPESDFKMKYFYDFSIRQNILNKKALELNIVNLDKTITPISWKTCITGKHHDKNYLLNSALRHSITNQIIDFKNNNFTTKCSMCNHYTNSIHIDHVLQFKDIVENFKMLNNIDISDITFDTDLKTNQCIFKEKDSVFRNNFVKYHLEHATLRIVCARCNLTRNKKFCDSQTEYVIDF